MSESGSRPRGVHHVTIISNRSDALVAFFRDALGMPVVLDEYVSHDQGGPFLDAAGVEPVRSTMLGDAREGLIEVVAVSSVPPREAAADRKMALTFTVDDVDAVLERAHRAGHTSTGVETVMFNNRTVHVALVDVAEVAVQLVQQAPPGRLSPAYH